MDQYIICDQICQSMPIPRLKSDIRDSLLKTLYEDIVHSFSKPIPPSIQPNFLEKTTKYIQGEQFSFIPEEIRDNIHTMDKGEHSKTEFVLPSGRSVLLYIWFPHKSTKRSAHKILKKIYQWLSYLDTFVSDSCSKDLTIYLYMTKLCKKLPAKTITLDVNCINNAFSYPCKPTNEIYIYREEEWFKVFIHETMHAMGLDFAGYDYSKTSNRIHHIVFSGVPSNNIDLTEAYTETWAEILIILINVYYTTHQLTYTRQVSQIVEKSIYYEKVWALIQCIKVLNHQHISYQDLLLGQPYRENTAPVFAYFVLKAICMFHMEDFLEWCNTHKIQQTSPVALPPSKLVVAGILPTDQTVHDASQRSNRTRLSTDKKSHNIFVFHYSIHNIQSFGDFIIKHAFSQMFTNCINKIEYQNHHLGHSLRMSLWG
jgi:hypothetical protein